MPTRLDSIVIDAMDPGRLGRFWSAALGAPIVHESEKGVRIAVPGAFDLPLDFVPVLGHVPRPHRLHLDLYGGARRDAWVAELLQLGAAHVDIGQGEVPWTVLVDPEDYAFCVMPERPEYVATGPIAAIPIDVDDKDSAFAFWRDATGWVSSGREYSLRHPSGTGPLLEFCDPVEAKRGKNPMHLDLRASPEDDYDDILRGLLAAGATLADHDWGPLPWTVLIDPGGNECCLLRARTGPDTATYG